MAHVGGWELDLSTWQMQWTKEVFAIHEIEGDQPPALQDAIAYYAPEGRPMMQAAVENAIANGQSWDMELPFITAKNRHRWVRAQGAPIYKNGQVSKLAGAFQDITQRKQGEIDLAWVNHALLMLSKCNETLIHMTDETRLVVEICRTIVEVGGYHMAWVGYAMDDEHKSIQPYAYYGHNQGFLEQLKLSWSADTATGQGPGGRTIRGGQAIIVEDIVLDPTYPVKLAAQQQGYRALVSLPLKSKSGTYGLLAMYASQVRKFGADEVRLLQDLANNLGAGIHNIRVEKERQRLNTAMLKLAQAVSGSRGVAFLEQLVRNMVDTLDANAGYMAQLLQETPLKGRTVSVQVDGVAQQNFDYSIPACIAQGLFGHSDLKIVHEHAYRDYPGISMMRFHQYQAFAGLRLFNSQGVAIGLLFVFFRQPVQPQSNDLIKSALTIFAARAASELERMEIDARVREQASLLDKTSDAIIVRNLDHSVTYWNKAAEALFGWTEQEVMHQPIYRFLKQDPQQLQHITEQLLAHGEWIGEIKEFHKSGHWLIIESHLTLVRDAYGHPKSIFAIKSNITQRKSAEDEIRQLAFYDPLTQLPNRRLLLDRLQQALVSVARSKLYGALLFVDLDNFKRLNDTLGHDTGDALLKGVAERLKDCVRDCDTVSRLGGDEFVIMLENMHERMPQARQLATAIGQKIIDTLNQPFDFDGYRHVSTPSIGIALFNHHTAGLDELFKQADSAMYKSKAAGRNRMSFYDQH